MAVKWKWNNNTGGGSVSPELSNKVQQLETNYTTLNNEAVKKTGDQNIAGTKTFTKQGEPIQVKPSSGSAYITGYTGTTKKWAIGNNGSDTHFKLEASANDGNILLSPGSNGDVLNNSNKNWNQLIDNSVVRQKDFKYIRKLEKISGLTQPTANWNYTGIEWDLSNINTDGLHEFIVVVSFNGDKIATLKMDLLWKNGIPESQTGAFIVEKDGIDFYFRGAIKQNNKFSIYYKKAGTSSHNPTVSWIRVWVLRESNQPAKFNTIW